MKKVVLSRSYWLGFASATLVLCGVYLTLMLSREKINPPEAVCMFVQHRQDFESCVALIRNGALVPNGEGRYPIPPELGKRGIKAIWIDHDFVFFRSASKWIDNPWEVIIYDMRKRAVVDCTSSLTMLYPRRVTYHIQYIKGADGWYYWKYE